MGDSSSVAFSQTSFLASQATQWPFLYQPTLEATLFNVRAVVMTETAAAVLVGTAAPVMVSCHVGADLSPVLCVLVLLLAHPQLRVVWSASLTRLWSRCKCRR